MMTDKLLKFILSLKDDLPSFKGAFEPDIRERIVRPVLELLGWKPLNIGSEYSLNKGRVDYGLLIPERKNELQCIIEVKAMGVDLCAAESQLLKYAFQDAPPLAILTDGAKWRFYFSTGVGNFKERFICALDIQEDLPDKIVDVLERYLSFQNTLFGKAKKNVKADHEERITKESISLAWKKIRFSEKLIDMVIGQATLISGDAPSKAYVEEFLKNLGGNDNEPVSDIQKGLGVSFVLFNEEHEEKDNASAFIKIVELLAGKDQSFLERLAPKINGKNKRLSKNRAEMSDYDQKAAKKVADDWWLTTHSSTKGKRSILRKACEVAGIPFNKREGLIPF